MDLPLQVPKISFQKARLELNTDSSVEANVCDETVTFRAFYHFPRILLCMNSVTSVTCDGATSAVILMFERTLQEISMDNFSLKL